MKKILINSLKDINKSSKSDSIAFGLFDDQQDLFSNINKDSNSILSELNQSGDLSSKLGEISVIYTPNRIFKGFKYSKIFIIGLGNNNKLDNNSLRSAAGNLSRKIQTSNCNSVNFVLDSFINKESNYFELSQSFIEGFLLGSYSFNKYKSSKSSEKELYFDVTSSKINSELDISINKAIINSEAEKKARNLVNEPANIMSPSELSKFSLDLSNENLICKILDYDECKKLGMNAFLGVAQGSVEEPKLIHLSYKPNKDDKSATWYIGKAITFDSGGLSLKPSGSMLSMKGDMGGSAAVISAIEAISRLKIKTNIEVLCLATENMPSGSAQRPSDVVQAMDGTYIEVENTDAEGRLTLADAITYARKFNPKAIIDVATLTGAAGIGLGKGNISAFSNNEKLMSSVKKAGIFTGDSVWELPLDTVSKKQNNSVIADIKNTGGRLAGSITAAHFINHFVKETPWVHLDIAANMMSASAEGWYSKGATGIPTRLLIELAYALEN
ncbi:MAG: leucyl aminopeptidase [Dehalococcoidia bacterium]|nr:leucyl aminopeptidase [Dehalococcoidia bacterium]